MRVKKEPNANKYSIYDLSLAKMEIIRESVNATASNQIEKELAKELNYVFEKPENRLSLEHMFD